MEVYGTVWIYQIFSQDFWGTPCGCCIPRALTLPLSHVYSYVVNRMHIILFSHASLNRRMPTCCLPAAASFTGAVWVHCWVYWPPVTFMNAHSPACPPVPSALFPKPRKMLRLFHILSGTHWRHIHQKFSTKNTSRLRRFLRRVCSVVNSQFTFHLVSKGGVKTLKITFKTSIAAFGEDEKK